MVCPGRPSLQVPELSRVARACFSSSVPLGRHGPSPSAVRRRREWKQAHAESKQRQRLPVPANSQQDLEETARNRVASYLGGKSHYSRKLQFNPRTKSEQRLTRSTAVAAFDDVFKQLEDAVFKDPVGHGFRQPRPYLEQSFRKFKQQLLERDDAGTDSPALRSMKQWLLAPAKQGGILATATFLELKYAFYDWLVRPQGANAQDYQKLLRKTARIEDYASEFPAARMMRRQIHVHVGPTNSGKTYHALKRLMSADTGFYAGPLRLLALEVYSRIHAQMPDKRISLQTGDDRRVSHDPTEDEIPIGASIYATTVEMTPMDRPMDVGVIDEIQLIGDEERGWAWTLAFMGAQVKELHVCGEPRTVPLLRELAALCGDDIHIHRYERLTPLKTGPSFNGDLGLLEKGDCIVAFSIKRLHELRRKIEQKTGKQCAIIYGALPPETRASQAALFNDPNNDYDYLVATNAIGMGLNLSIRRMIFESTSRKIAEENHPLSTADIKQIAGRAGRFSSAAEDNRRHTNLDTVQEQASNAAAKPGGVVTALSRRDMSHLELCMNQEPEPIASAGVLPSRRMVERFMRCFPEDVSFTYLMHQLRAYNSFGPRLHLCMLASNLGVADALESVPLMRPNDRFLFMQAPINTNRPEEITICKALGAILAEGRSARVTEIPELELELLEGPTLIDRLYLQQLEQLFRNLVIFTWLAYKKPGVYLDVEMASEARRLTSERIQEVLKALVGDQPDDTELYARMPPEEPSVLEMENASDSLDIPPPGEEPFMQSARVG